MSYAKRREAVLALLRWYTDATCTLQRGDQGGSFYPDSRLLRMPAVYRRSSYRALERCLGDLKVEDKAAFLGVRSRYIWAERRKRFVRKLDEVQPNERLISHGVEKALDRYGRKFVATWVFVERWHPDTDLDAAERGVDYLVRKMPAEIRVPTVQGGWVEDRPGKWINLEDEPLVA